MEKYPRIIKVEATTNKRLIITFNNNIKKIYDCSPLLEDDAFKPLLNDSVFKAVKADKHGYGVCWSDDLDLSESELWINGIPVEQLANLEKR